MPRVFIVRPFNVKEGVNFEAVDALLIQPALKAAGEEGATTTNIAHAGNIREDMFRLLVTADLVIADVSIHNANVFYELGVRHGLRPRGTLLIRAAVQEYPFDLQTDRFLLYDPAKPEASVGKLTAAITATLATVAYRRPEPTARSTRCCRACRSRARRRCGSCRRTSARPWTTPPPRRSTGICASSRTRPRGSSGRARGCARWGARSSASARGRGRATRSRRCAGCCRRTWRRTSAGHDLPEAR